jgi:hypothetical protein
MKSPGNWGGPWRPLLFGLLQAAGGWGKVRQMAVPTEGKYLLKRLAEICKTILAGSRAMSRTDRGYSCRGPAFRNRARKAQRIVVHSYPEKPSPFRQESFAAGCIFRIERDHTGIPQALLGER